LPAMFTGIIQHIGTIAALEKGGDWRVVIEADMDLSKTPMGASIACSGCCLTVVELVAGGFAVQVSGETLAKTTIGSWGVGTKINLEPSLKMGDEMGGHIVSGHVDALASIKSIQKDGDSHRLTLQIPANLVRFVAPKGSITLDGISLTVNEVRGDTFGVNIIPHTWAHTTFGSKKEGDRLNLEVDMLARYVARMLEAQSEKAA
jgi:riboflavin synthase